MISNKLNNEINIHKIWDILSSKNVPIYCFINAVDIYLDYISIENINNIINIDLLLETCCYISFKSYSDNYEYVNSSDKHKNYDFTEKDVLDLEKIIFKKIGYLVFRNYKRNEELEKLNTYTYLFICAKLSSFNITNNTDINIAVNKILNIINLINNNNKINKKDFIDDFYNNGIYMNSIIIEILLVFKKKYIFKNVVYIEYDRYKHIFDSFINNNLIRESTLYKIEKNESRITTINNIINNEYITKNEKKFIMFQKTRSNYIYSNNNICLKKPIDSKDYQLSTEFIKEISILYCLNHENIINILGFNINSIYLEKADTDLYSFIICNNIYNNHRKSIIRQIINGLQYLHNNDIIHCDLKPTNILLFNNNTIIKICDFGNSYNTTYIPKIDLCTTNYASIESIIYKKNSKSSDVWSLGCILYFVHNRIDLFMPKMTKLDIVKSIISYIGYNNTYSKEFFKNIMDINSIKKNNLPNYLKNIICYEESRYDINHISSLC